MAERLTSCAGGGQVHATVVDGLSAATAWHARNPLKLLLPRARGPAVWACAATYGGGLVAGDAVALDLEAGPGATLFLGTQSTTKVYRSTGATATQRLTARIGAGGLLAVLPEPVSCFAGSRYAQTATIACADGGSVAWLDAVSAGRVACGERWQLAAYASRTDLYREGRLVLRDTLRLDAASAPAGRLGRMEVFAGLLLIGPRCAPAAQSAAACAEACRPGRNDLLATWNPQPGGGLLRLAAATAEILAQTVHRLLGPLARELDGEPWLRLTACVSPATTPEPACI